MSLCNKIRRKHRKVCIGDLDTLINIKARDEVVRNFVSKEEFTTVSSPWALWETVKGIEVFDETNTSERATDIAIIRYDPTVTKEFFVELDGENFRILEVEDFDRRKEWLLITMTNRGTVTKEVNDG